MRAAAALAAAAALLLTACPGDPSHRQPASQDDGIQATGRVGGTNVAVSDGEPEVLLGDCDRRDGDDTDLCISSFTVDGSPFGIVIENPEALEVGRSIPVGTRCQGCVHVEIRRAGEQLTVTAGSVEVLAAEERFAARFELRRPPRTRLTGRFDVAPPFTP